MDLHCTRTPSESANVFNIPFPEPIEDRDYQSPPSNAPWCKTKIIKNLLIVSLSYLLLFTAFQGLATLESTMNSEHGVGVASQATIYAFICITSMFLPKFFVKKFGCKLTLTLSILTYCPYFASNFYPHWITLIPTAALLGTGGSLMWASSCTYMTELSLIYGEITKQPVKSITAYFFGISGMLFMSSNVWGNLISYYIIQEAVNYGNETTVSCGAEYCNVESKEANSNLKESSIHMRYVLTMIFLACGVLAAILVALFMDPLQCDMERSKCKKIQLSVDLATATFRLMKETKMLLLVPFSFFFGLVEAFYIGDFTKSYIACALGMSQVSFVSICFGTICVLSSTLSGWFVKYLDRFPVFFAAAAVNLATCISLLMWKPDPDKPLIFFVLAGMFGFITGIYWSQIKAFYGVLFKGDEEAAFANYVLWNSLGNCLSLAYSSYLCTTTKIYVMTVFFCIGIIGYTVVEIRMFHKNRNR